MKLSGGERRLAHHAAQGGGAAQAAGAGFGEDIVRLSLASIEAFQSLPRGPAARFGTRFRPDGWGKANTPRKSRASCDGPGRYCRAWAARVEEWGEAMRRRRAIGIGWVTSAAVGFSRLAHAQNTSAASSSAPRQQLGGGSARAAALLRRMHHAAQREVQLGEAAEVGAQFRSARLWRPAYRDLQPSTSGCGRLRLRRISDAELDRLHSGRERGGAEARGRTILTRLANTTGATVRSGFWVTVAHAQAADVGRR